MERALAMLVVERTAERALGRFGILYE